MATRRNLTDLLGATGPAPDTTGTPGPDPAPEAAPAQPEDGAAVLVPSAGQADRITIYLHPDDHRALGLAKVDDRVDHNTRVRAMIALWRTDPQFRDRIDTLTRPHKR